MPSPVRSAPPIHDDAALGAGAPTFVVGPRGHRIYVDPSDQRAQALIEAKGDLNWPALVIWQLLIDERDWTHIVDVGANYGEMLAGARVPNVSVMAIEPNPHVLPYLTRTLSESGLTVELIPAAASDRTGAIEMSVDRTWSGMSSMIAGQRHSEGHVIETHTVPTTTLEMLIRERGKGSVRLLVKIDVEGYEIAVLRGLENLLPDLDEFAVMIEILHLGNEDLDWILSRFDLAVLDLQQKTLITADAATAQELRALLAAENLYRHDAVLCRKQTAT